MTRKQFRRIAAILAGDLATATDEPMREKVRHIALSLSDVCCDANPYFDRRRFYVACGLSADGSLIAREV